MSDGTVSFSRTNRRKMLAQRGGKTKKNTQQCESKFAKNMLKEE